MLMAMDATSSSRGREPFDALTCAYRNRLYRYACRLLANRDDAEDLLQQSLLEAYVAFDRFQPGTRFDRWVARIMYRTCIDIVRRRPHCVIQSLDVIWETDDHSVLGRAVEDPRAGPETLLMENTLSEPLQQAIEVLPADFRAVVFLADIQGLSYEEVAGALDCPVGTVRSRLHRARARIRGALGNWSPCSGA
jgi:RNA polymerase sigma-70 factor (ECF subfamily)